MLSAKHEPMVRTRAVRGSWLEAGAIVNSVLNIERKNSRRHASSTKKQKPYRKAGLLQK
jgi:hypothetical protein